MLIELHPTFEESSVLVNLDNVLLIRKEEPRGRRGEREHELGSEIIFVGDREVSFKETKEQILEIIKKTPLN
jgi:hypothetical protein